MTVRDVRVWTCDVGGCHIAAEKQINTGRFNLADDKHDLPTGWSSISVLSIRGHHNVTKFLCPDHAIEHIMPMFPEYDRP